ncbi:MAG: hypothetical protein ACRDOU_33595 [Streptosporangiaceae bacterium]
MSNFVIVTEVQKDPPDGDKRRAWVAYLALAQVEHKCDAALVVIALRERTARACVRPIATGHPGFVLAPIVIGPGTIAPPGGPRAGQVSAELAVLAVLTGTLDLGDAETRRLVLQAIAQLDAERREIYTRLIRATAPTTRSSVPPTPAHSAPIRPTAGRTPTSCWPFAAT